jgi:hypothetical protein
MGSPFLLSSIVDIFEISGSALSSMFFETLCLSVPMVCAGIFNLKACNIMKIRELGILKKARFLPKIMNDVRARTSAMC